MENTKTTKPPEGWEYFPNVNRLNMNEYPCQWCGRKLNFFNELTEHEQDCESWLTAMAEDERHNEYGDHGDE